MPRLIEGPTQVEAAGTPPKTIREHVGVVNTGEQRVSVAHMTSPAGWAEPWQQPDFDEWTVVLAGAVLVGHDGGGFFAAAGGGGPPAGPAGGRSPRRARRRVFRRVGGSGGPRGCRRAGALQHAGRRRLRRHLPAGVHARRRAPRELSRAAPGREVSARRGVIGVMSPSSPA